MADYDIILANYLELDIIDIVKDLSNYDNSQLEEMRRTLHTDILGGNRHSPDWWLLKLLDKEIKSRK